MSRLFASALASRLLGLLIVLFGVATIAFFATRIIPADPVRMAAGLGATPESVALLRNRLGLDDPVWQQFLRYIAGVARFDFGTSIGSQQPVSGEILERLPATLELVFLSLGLSVVLSVMLGIGTSGEKGIVATTGTRIGFLVASSTPPYWLALILQLIFYYHLGWFPYGERDGRVPISDITGFRLVDGLVTLNGPALGASLLHLFLPCLTLALASVGYLARLVRSEIRETDGQDFAVTLRARGVPRRRLTWRHVLPNALNPLITVVGMQVGFTIGGAIFIEQIFRWPGLASYTFRAIQTNDYNAICGATVVLAFVFVVASNLVDLVQQWVDPRMRMAA